MTTAARHFLRSDGGVLSMAACCQPGRDRHVPPGAAPAVAMVVALQAVHQGDAGRRLQARIEGGAHIVAALVRSVAHTLQLQGLVARLLHEIVGVMVFRAGRRDLDLEILGHGRLGLRLAHPAQIGHVLQDHVAPADSGGLVA